MAANTSTKPPRRRLMAPATLAAAVLVGAAAALVSQLLSLGLLGPTPHDPTAPSHFLEQGPRLLPGATATRVPIEGLGEATVLVVAAAAAAAEKQTKKPLVLLLHGFPDDAAGFHRQVGPLAAAGYDVVVPVLPGYEPSTAGLPPAAYGLPGVADALAQVSEWALRARGREQVCTVMGWGDDWGVTDLGGRTDSPIYLDRCTSSGTTGAPRSRTSWGPRAGGWRAAWPPW